MTERPPTEPEDARSPDPERVAESGAVGRRWATVARRSFAALALVFVIAIAALSEIPVGQEFALNTALDRIRGALAGELTVGAIRSGTLLTGATLIDLRLDAADGRQFMRADSVVVRYSLPSVLLGGSGVRSTTFWGADIEISRYSADDVLNVTRILAEGDPDSTSVVLGQPIDLGRIGIRDGTVYVLTPARVATAATVPAPDGSPLRRIAFENLDLDLENILLRPGAAVSLEADLASLSASVHLVEEPLVLREVFGDVTFGAQGIRVQNAAFRLPSTLLRGDLTFGPKRPGGVWQVSSSLEADGWGDLADLAWIDCRIPAGRFRGRVAFEVPGVVEVDFDQFEVELEASNLLVDGWVRFDEALSLRTMDVTVSPLALSRLEPWLDLDFPLDGWLSGRATFSGSLADLVTTGRVTLVPTGYGGGATTADFSGTIYRGENPGATGLEVRLDPLNYRVLQSLWPDAPVAGTGTGLLEIDGRADTGLTIIADFTHEADPTSESRAVMRGVVRRLEDGGWVTDMRGDLIPLSIATFARFAPELGLRGSLGGEVRVQGSSDDLRVSADLVTEGGGIVLNAALDLRASGIGYRLDIEADGLPLSSLTSELPPRSSWTGRLELEGTGFTLDSMETTGTFVASASRIGSVAVDTVSASFRVRGGVLITDTLEARVGGVDFHGRGRFGLAEGSWGSSHLSFEGATLIGLRSLVMGVGDSIIVNDGLSALQSDAMRSEGIDPDTLPSELDVRMAGAVQGAMSISGEIRSFDLGLQLLVVDAAYRRDEVDTLRIALTATGLPSTDGSWYVGATVRGLSWHGRSFEQGGVEAEMIERTGTGRIELVRGPDEQYRAAGSFRIDSVGGELGLTDAQIQVGESFWNLARPSRIAWNQTSLVVDSLEITRLGDDPMSLTANGVLTRGGASDFHLVVEGLHAEEVVDLAQIGDLDVSGHIDVDVTVLGPSEAPVITALFRIEGPRYASMELAAVDGSLDYADRSASFRLSGHDGDRDVIEVSGTFPIDLSLTAVADRVLSQPMAIEIAADSLDAALALGYLTSLEDVLGVVSGDVHIGGTPDAPEPEGLVTLTDAAWTLDAIGVRHTSVDASLTLNPDRTADLALSFTGAGSLTVTGTVTLEPLRDPRLDLTFAFDRFQAVQRIDVEGLISGEVVLGGRYRRPLAEGSLTLDEGTIYVDEFQRAAGVLDLSDPLIFRGFGVDTTALVTQRLVAGLRNPFFDNLRVDIDLTVPRDTWLRSIETQVEMAGELVVAYDRSVADLVMIGELQALRGSHLVLGRSFPLDGGSVRFNGRPGLNPDLDIRASTRIRRRDSEDLEIFAHVGGTLIQPVVTLSTDEVGTSQSDLISYLIFGQSRGELGGNQSELFGGIGQNTAFSTLSSGGLTYIGGALANQFSAVIAQGIGLDYLSVQVGVGSTDANTSTIGLVEAGRYLGNDVFVVLVFQPSAQEIEGSKLRGARVEWALTGDYYIEGFLEDRFLRSGTTGFAIPGLLDNTRVVGLLIFRDWGY